MTKLFIHTLRGPRARLATLFLLLVALWYFRAILYTASTLLLLPFGWSRGSSEFIISQGTDGFDLSFANYGILDASAGMNYIDRVPPVLHHILLGSVPLNNTWKEARQSCLDFHPGWEAHLWTDEDAEQFVTEKFPDFKGTWDGYRFLIQKVDALRYLVLYEYGGKHLPASYSS